MGVVLLTEVSPCWWVVVVAGGNGTSPLFSPQRRGFVLWGVLTEQWTISSQGSQLYLRSLYSPCCVQAICPLAVQCTCFLFQADWLSFIILGTTLVLWGMSYHAEEVHVCSRTAIIPTYRNTEFRVMPSKEPVSSFASLSRRLSPYSNRQGSAMVPTSTFVPWEAVPALPNALQGGRNISSCATQGILRSCHQFHTSALLFHKSTATTSNNKSETENFKRYHFK